jgi:hypothetical protein
MYQCVNAGHLPHRGGQERETPAVPSEKGVARSGSEDDEMRMISARFARVLQPEFEEPRHTLASSRRQNKENQGDLFLFCHNT